MNETENGPLVCWAMPLERQVIAPVVNAGLNVAICADRRGYQRLEVQYGRVDVARNGIAELFMAATDNPDAWIVMLDDDHKHPPEIVHDLTSTGKRGVVGALARRRGGEHDVLAWTRNAEGFLAPVTEWTPGDILPVAVVSTSAIAIQRWVFDRLTEKGCPFPFFRYAYKDNAASFPSEDMYFAGACEYARVPMWLHTGVVIPHAVEAWV